jgi:hypothetical protein
LSFYYYCRKVDSSYAFIIRDIFLWEKRICTAVLTVPYTLAADPGSMLWFSTFRRKWIPFEEKHELPVCTSRKFCNKIASVFINIKYNETHFNVPDIEYISRKYLTKTLFQKLLLRGNETRLNKNQSERLRCQLLIVTRDVAPSLNQQYNLHA